MMREPELNPASVGTPEGRSKRLVQVEPRPLRLVIVVLAVLGAVAWFQTASDLLRSEPAPISQNLIAPFLAWGLHRRRRAAWVASLIFVWATLASLAAVLLYSVSGRQFRFTVVGFDVGWGSATAWIGVTAIVAVLFWMHWELTRPDTRRLFSQGVVSGSGVWWCVGGVTWAGVATLASQTIGGFFAAAMAGKGVAGLSQQELSANGLVLSAAACVAAPVCVAMIAGVIYARERAPVGEFLALRSISAATMAVCVAATLVFAGGYALVSAAAGRPASAFLDTLIRTAPSIWLLAVAFCVLVPIGEEVVFRGYLYGIAKRAGAKAVIAVVATSAAFAAVHAGQYAGWELSGLFVLGLLLGTARERSGSLYAPIAMHSAFNTVAIVGQILGERYR